ncbi:DUF427 domain-containing protein [Actinoplanes sp. NPDC048796]|uniref:DUF427 domain-containing protein n=1 Tax=unclassified Actinoplanes TaxID=2626549 RepID=UPI0033E2032B
MGMTSDFPREIAAVNQMEPSPRRVRAMLGGRVVVDTTRAVYLWEIPSYPQYYIPIEDVAEDVIVDEEHEQRLSRGRARRLGLRSGDVHRPAAGRHYVESKLPGLPGLVRFEWDALDAWFEEDEEIFGHPRNPYHRVDALRSSRRVRVELDGVVLAESSSPVLLFETGLPTRYYLDRTAVDVAALTRSETRTHCPYKGSTTDYWSVGDQADLAWSYGQPYAAVGAIAGLVAFYNEKVDTYLDGRLLERPVTVFSKKS